MKLWILRPARIEDDEFWRETVSRRHRDNPWSPWYDKTLEMLVRAPSESEARQLAAARDGEWGGRAWLNPAYSSCVELSQDGAEGVLMSNVLRA